ncbi:hypothetical protein OH768_09255 [Streptomyces sp. NBC_01622]|uniref:hypothetical protein n=1 Tax=Streptomyces sp. NBC_01622 TaxID=2975903 RepID=UPI003867F50A|nr:hypothetical protein OH768_09255 [Streptomyces sp. NBC_01622]
MTAGPSTSTCGQGRDRLGRGAQAGDLRGGGHFGLVRADAAHREKCGAYTDVVDRVLTEQGRWSTLRLVPRS